jgi:hypothetical protein
MAVTQTRRRTVSVINALLLYMMRTSSSSYDISSSSYDISSSRDISDINKRRLRGCLWDRHCRAHTTSKKDVCVPTVSTLSSAASRREGRAVVPLSLERAAVARALGVLVTTASTRVCALGVLATTASTRVCALGVLVTTASTRVRALGVLVTTASTRVARSFVGRGRGKLRGARVSVTRCWDGFAACVPLAAAEGLPRRRTKVTWEPSGPASRRCTSGVVR